MIPGTRWVTLRDLYNHCAMANLDVLDAFDKQLMEEMKLVRDDILEEYCMQQEEEEDSEPLRRARKGTYDYLP